MEKLTISWLGQKKDINTKFGLKQKQSLKATQRNDTYLDFWCSPLTDAWRIGDTIEVEVKSREYNGKTYYDIVLPKANMGNLAEVYKRFEKLEGQMVKFGLAMAQVEAKLFPQKTPAGAHYPTPEEEGIVLDDHTGEEANLEQLDEVPF